MARLLLDDAHLALRAPAWSGHEQRIRRRDDAERRPRWPAVSADDRRHADVGRRRGVCALSRRRVVRTRGRRRAGHARRDARAG